MENPQARVVDGSNGLLLEVDGQIVPNYDATFHGVRGGRRRHRPRRAHRQGRGARRHRLQVRGRHPGRTSSRSASPSNPPTRSTLGEEVDALVMTKEDQDGRLILSQEARPLREGLEAHRSAPPSRGEPVEGTVIEVVKGGLILDLGVRGFLPASLVDIRRVPDLDEYMGQKLECQGHRAEPLAQQRRPLAAARCSRRSARRCASRSSTDLSRATSSRARSRTSSTSARSSTSTASTA